MWISRHKMTDEQAADLRRTLLKGYGDGAISIVTENVAWAASADNIADARKNIETLRDLVTRNNAEVVTGVFPPVVTEAFVWRCASDMEPNELIEFKMFSPVSRQKAADRANGSKVITFEHVRWAYLGVPAI